MSSPRTFGHVDTWVFDLDNTLYPHHVNLWQQVDVRIRDYVARFLKLPADEAFIIQGNDASKVRLLFSNPRVRELVSAQPEIEFTVKDDEGWFGPKFPEGVDELCFLAHGVVKDVARLEQVYELFAEVLDELCRMGAAYETDPHVSL